MWFLLHGQQKCDAQQWHQILLQHGDVTKFCIIAVWSMIFAVTAAAMSLPHRYHIIHTELILHWLPTLCHATTTSLPHHPYRNNFTLATNSLPCHYHIATTSSIQNQFYIGYQLLHELITELLHSFRVNLKIHYHPTFPSHPWNLPALLFSDIQW